MDEALAQLTREWLTKALHDLQTARIIANAPDGPLDTAIYHCQQAAEKSLKGWLTARSDPFEKTHDIRRLIKQAAGVLPDFNQFCNDNATTESGGKTKQDLVSSSGKEISAE